MRSYPSLTVTKHAEPGTRGMVVAMPETRLEVLVRQAKSGSTSAQEALFKRFLGMAHSLASRLAPSESEDIVQEAFAIALDKLEQLKTPEAFGGWLRAIVIDVARRTIRKNRFFQALGLRSREDEEDLSAMVVARGLTAEEGAELRLLYTRLNRFPTEVRVALVLRLVEERTVAEIASELRVSEPTVKRRLKQGTELLERYGMGGSRR